MQDDKTVLMRQPGRGGRRHSPLSVSYQTEDGEGRTALFDHPFVVGRSSDCDVTIHDEGVSRQHVRVYPADNLWVIEDLESANGAFVDGRLINRETVDHRVALQLGVEGPVIWLEPVSRPGAINDGHKRKRPEEGVAGEALIRKYLGDEPEGPMGDRTRMVRQAIRKKQKEQSHYYRMIIGVIAAILIVVAGLAAYQHTRLAKARSLAVEMFYDMKELEIQVARAELRTSKTASLAQVANVQRKREKLSEMSQRYQDYLAELESFNILKKRPGKTEELILKVARLFGECELQLPPGFIEKVNEYIQRWKKSNRYNSAIQRLDRLEFKPRILEILRNEGLPTQFLFLAMQESNFRKDAIGPKTRFGIAKGPWQFIPGTAVDYGLKIGPLASVPKFDPQDERFDFIKATRAAAHYLKDIYATEAQASGLLVMASYNWGHNRVRKLIKSMPDNPKDRNFWKLINQYRIPDETYDYVFYIFSAAVIAEDPRRFGFKFDPPLE